MDFNDADACEEPEKQTHQQQFNRKRVRDMVKLYDTAVNSDSAKTSYSSIISAKSSLFGANGNNSNPPSNMNASRNVSPTHDCNLNSLFLGPGCNGSDLVGSPSRSSSSSRQTVRSTRSPRLEMPTEVKVSHLDTQKSFMNLSRTREPPKAAPREKKPRHSEPAILSSSVTHSVPVPQHSVHSHREEHLNVTDSSYQSKTTISKTPNGVRIIIDIFFDQNKGITIEDVVGSRVETDIPPSKILSEFQRRVAESSRN